MRQYEMTYLLSDKVNDNEITATTGKINGIITGRKGRILGEENWGRRKLAYPIVKQDFATYITLNFELEPDQLAKIIRDLKLTKEVIRHLIVVKDYGKEELKLSVDEIAETEEIEEVVGGEKSFEAIEGETEQSYDLMAKREETSEESEGDADTADKEIEAEKKPETEEKATEAKPESETIKEEEKVEVEEAEVSKSKKRTVKKEKSLEAEVEKEDKKIAKKTIKAEAVDDKKQKAEAEADRLAKLDEEIEGILGDDL